MSVYSSGNLETLVSMDFDFQWYIDSSKIASKDNLTDPFPKALPERVFENM